MSLDEIRLRNDQWQLFGGIRGQRESAEDVPLLVEAVEAVLDRHHPDADTGKCAECTPAKYSPMSTPWPCPTVNALTSILEAKR